MLGGAFHLLPDSRCHCCSQAGSTVILLHPKTLAAIVNRSQLLQRAYNKDAITRFTLGAVKPVVFIARLFGACYI